MAEPISLADALAQLGYQPAADLSQRLANVDSEIQSLDNAQQSQYTQTQLVKSQINAINLTPLQEGVDANQLAIQSLQSASSTAAQERVAAAGEINTLALFKEEASSSISSLETASADHAARIAALESDSGTSPESPPGNSSSAILEMHTTDPNHISPTSNPTENGYVANQVVTYSKIPTASGQDAAVLRYYVRDQNSSLSMRFLEGTTTSDNSPSGTPNGFFHRWLKQPNNGNAPEIFFPRRVPSSLGDYPAWPSSGNV